MGAACFRSPSDTAGIQFDENGKRVKSGKAQRYLSDKERYGADPTRNTQHTTAVSTPSTAVSTHAVELLIAEGKKVIKALYDYTPMSAEQPAGSGTPDLAFKKDDIMEVINEEGDWWVARCLLSGAIGYVPSTYVAPFSGLQGNEWFHGGVGKKDVDKLLTASSNERGTFLVRESETRPGTYALSVLDITPDKGRTVKHYRINNMDNGGCYVASRKTFTSLEEMINYYSGIPATKEPNDLARTDGKRPDGLSLGKTVTWGVTVADTVASSYLPITSNTAGAAAAAAAERKTAKNTELMRHHLFVPIAIETFGPICEEGQHSIREIGKRISHVTSDPRETAFLFQRLSIAIQRFNAVCFAGTFPILDS